MDKRYESVINFTITMGDPQQGCFIVTITMAMGDNFEEVSLGGETESFSFVFAFDTGLGNQHSVGVVAAEPGIRLVLPFEMHTLAADR